MKLERNLFFRGHRKIVILLLTGVRTGGVEGREGRFAGRSRGKVVRVGGGFTRTQGFSTVFTNRQTVTDRQAG